jgi:LysM repeat protein
MADRLAANSLELIMDRVTMKLKEKHYADALSILSTVNDSPDLPPLKAREITGILDQLAARVIYSREHLLEPAYRVEANDTLDSIADRYGVPALLLAHINGIGDPRDLRPGKELKVLKGPFTAFISTDHSELTMRVNGLYAGRFSVSLSDDLSHASNWYTVRKPSPPPTSSFSGRDAAPEIELVSERRDIVAMRGTNDTRVATGRDSRNTIWLSMKDMDDVYGILSVGSRVIIQR